MGKQLTQTDTNTWTSESEQSRMKVLYGLILISLVFVFSQFVEYSLNGYWIAAVNQSVFGIVLAAGLLPFLRARKALNLNVLLASANINITVDTLLFGQGVGNEYYMFPLLIAPLILIDLNNWFAIGLATSWTLVANVFVVSLGEIQPLYQLDDLNTYHTVNFIIACILTTAQGHLIFLASRKLLLQKTELIEKLKSEYEENVRIQKLMVSQQRTAELGLMAGGIAHEIKNPLTVIRGQSELLTSVARLDQLSRDVVLKKTESIIKATQRITSIVDGMSILGRKSDADSYSTSTVPEILSYLEAAFGSQFIAKGIEFKVLDHSSSAEIECRKGQIAQLLLNLISNATYELEQSRGEKWICLEFVDRNDKIEASVADSGPGVSPENRSKIFQAFFTTKQVGQGTGLGLSISKAIARDHGGDLYLDDSSRNTRFVLVLPKVRSLKSVS